MSGVPTSGQLKGPNDGPVGPNRPPSNEARGRPQTELLLVRDQQLGPPKALGTPLGLNFSPVPKGPAGRPASQMQQRRKGDQADPTWTRSQVTGCKVPEQV